MSLYKPWHLVVFALCLGSTVYLANALWSAFFIVSIPQGSDLSIDAREHQSQQNSVPRIVQTDSDEAATRDILENSVYVHNLQMRDRSRLWFNCMLMLGAAVGFVVFFLIPQRRGKLNKQMDPAGHGVFGAAIGSFVVVIFPLLLSWILPPPAEWFPKKIREMAKTRQKEALSRLKEEARGYRSQTEE